MSNLYMLIALLQHIYVTGTKVPPKSTDKVLVSGTGLQANEGDQYVTVN